MMRYRKKPVVIEAFQFPSALSPEWFKAAVAAGKVTVHPDAAFIETLEGTHRAMPGDWIIKGIKGEIYPCKPDIFAETYEPCEP